MVIVPPYCGLPSLSHQLPVVVVVFLVVVGVVMVVVLVVGLDVVGVDVVDDSGVDDVVDVLQDARTSVVTMRQVSTIQIAPFFIQSSFL